MNPPRIQAGIATLLVTACGLYSGQGDDLESRFRHPPPSARPAVLWMWMGGNVTSNGITRDLEALRDAGFGGATMFSLADVCTPWAGIISNSPLPANTAFTEPWWRLVRHAALEAQRLGLDFGVHNCAGYESSGGPWITPELSMQEIVWSETPVRGGTNVSVLLARPQPDLRARQPFPLWNPKNGRLEKPEVTARRSYYRDVAVLALPAAGEVSRDRIVNLSGRIAGDGRIDWDAPPGDWIIYRFGHTTMGSLLQPCQWDAIGLECDKMNRQAVEFHMNHIISLAKRHVGDLIGRGFNYFHFDSYEAGTPGWTPRMSEEFKARRGYDATLFLPTLAKRVVGSASATKQFQDDFQQTIRELHHENYFPTIQHTLHTAGLQFMCEPYGGPWDIAKVVPKVDRIMTEFWTSAGSYAPYQLVPTVESVRVVGRDLIEAEAFTGHPGDSQWTETPAWLKPIGDAAFCDGVNRLVLHRFTHQPFADSWRPGMVMGQWGTHFDRTQTWWEPGKAWIAYIARCQAMLQWGKFVPDGFAVVSADAGMRVESVHRREGDKDVYFVANLARVGGAVTCSFDVAGGQPELWHPVTGEMRMLPQFENLGGRMMIPLEFAPGESCFVVFRRDGPSGNRPADHANFPRLKPVVDLAGIWSVRFDSKWGGPEQSVEFPVLKDWAKCDEPGIRFYSGTAIYQQDFRIPVTAMAEGAQFHLDLGVVHELAEVWLNGCNLGVVWCAPWRVDASSAVRSGLNRLEIRVTNLWVNRLIGDEHEPADCEWRPGDQGYGGPLKAFPEWFARGMPRPSGRFTFTTWNYFHKDSALVPSGLLGPVQLLLAAQAQERSR